MTSLAILNLELEAIPALVSTHIDEVYTKLETLCLCFPSRLTGSDALEKALDYLYEEGKTSLMETKSSYCTFCTQETVPNVTRWERYALLNHAEEEEEGLRSERCLISIERGDQTHIGPIPYPSTRQVRILANGLSVGTPQALKDLPLIIVNSFDELHEKGQKNLLKDSIVLYDYQHFENYGAVAHYRYLGAFEAEKYGVKAVLIRTLTPDTSTSGPHTGVHKDDVGIPSACISIEDCEMMSRFAQRQYTLRVKELYMPCGIVNRTQSSRNIIFEIKGKEFPEEVSLF